ncbi:MAG TPA: hypothetical protein VN420_05660 [Candidatus Fimivivens sp.]|nr:hypothetical protein [Candidatus Fimivivens sp.]
MEKTPYNDDLFFRNLLNNNVIDMPNYRHDSLKPGTRSDQNHDPYHDNGGDEPGQPGYPPEDSFCATDDPGNARIGKIFLSEKTSE